MIPFHWLFKINRRNTESKSFTILRMQRNSKETIFQIYCYFIIPFMNVSNCLILLRFQNTDYSTQFNYLCRSRRKFQRINMWSNHIYFFPIEGLFINTVDVFFMGCMHKFTGNTKACIEAILTTYLLDNDYQFYLKSFLNNRQISLFCNNQFISYLDKKLNFY